MLMEEFSKFWEIYESSFPEDERRDQLTQKKILSNKSYKLIPYYKDGHMIGFAALWELGDLIFLEHLAIKEEFRGNGYGTKILEDIKHKHPNKVVLEVEPPKDDISIKRIKFYKKAGFHLNNNHYMQPPLGKGKKSVPLKIMSYPTPISSDKFDHIVNNIHTNIEHA